MVSPGVTVIFMGMNMKLWMVMVTLLVAMLLAPAFWVMLIAPPANSRVALSTTTATLLLMSERI
jgi:hypothetical protein